MHARKACLGVELQLHSFLNSAQDGGEWWASRLSRFIPGEGWEDPQVPI
jgi:hypothetical protein